MEYNFELPHLPKRSKKPRKEGVTMVMDKGLSLRQAEDFLENGKIYTDFLKLGFGSSIITNNLQEKINLYHKHGLRVYFGGTLFEAFIARNKFEDYLRLLDKFGLETAEVSDGSIEMAHDKKLEYINKLSSSRYVLSEVGSKEEGIIIHPNKWIKLM